MSGRLTFGDEALIKQFFGRYQVAFERSTAGATLERAELHGKLRPRDPDTGKDVFVSNDEQLVKLEQKYPAAREPRIAGGRIVYCDREVTAYPTAEMRAEGGYEIDSEVLIRYALVTRRLMALERQHKLSVQVLEAYYGDRGARCSEPRRDDDGKLIPAVGQLVALYPLTAAGRELLRLSEEPSTPRVGKKSQKKQRPRFHLTALERMENIVRQPQGRQHELLALAQRQATALLHEACERWNTIAGKHRVDIANRAKVARRWVERSHA